MFTEIDRGVFKNDKGGNFPTSQWGPQMLVALNIIPELVDTVDQVLPGIALPTRDQLPERVQQVYDCDIELSKDAGTFVPEEGMSWPVRDFMRRLKPALT